MYQAIHITVKFYCYFITVNTPLLLITEHVRLLLRYALLLLLPRTPANQAPSGKLSGKLWDI